MKNVMGNDVPVDTPEQLAAFYDRNVGPEFPNVYDPKHWGTDQVPGKDNCFCRMLSWAETRQPRTVLDVGADWGKYAWKAYQVLRPYMLYCMEVSSLKVKNLRKAAAFSNIPCLVMEGNAEIDPLPQSDLIIAMDIIEHFRDWRAGWRNLLRAGWYVFALIPCGQSFKWSDDHLHIFDDEQVDELTEQAEGVVWQEVIQFDADNSWYSLMVESPPRRKA